MQKSGRLTSFCGPQSKWNPTRYSGGEFKKASLMPLGKEMGKLAIMKCSQTLFLNKGQMCRRKDFSTGQFQYLIPAERRKLGSTLAASSLPVSPKGMIDT